MTVIQAYVPPSKKITKIELERFFQNRNKVVFMNDLNAKHRAWNCYHRNTKGNIILNYITSSQIVLSTPIVPTHFSKIGKPSVLDFF